MNTDIYSDISSMNTVIETAAGDLVRHTLSPDTTLG